MRWPTVPLLALLAFSAPLAPARAAAATLRADVAAALPPIDAGTSLLVVSPHPDDETLCCAGAIQRVVHAGGRVSVVWLTSGDAARIDLIVSGRSLFPSATVGRELGAWRMAEARRATARLGVAPAGQLFLGYPDGGLLELLSEHRTSVYTSASTGAAAVPYAEALQPGHPYTGESLERDFLSVLERTQPNLILAPTPLDAHSDHRAAGLLAQKLAAGRAAAAAVRYWIVHGDAGWPGPRELMPGVPLWPAPLASSLAPGAFALEPAEEDTKLLALRAYDSQMHVMAPFLLAFVRSNELYSVRAH
ncbi:MAG: PIG-L family deacetylase [Gammaproteobacteria bacterium]|nr:PIG-L family deacetylase [Gammaproteobacteria bacterium]